MRAAIYCRKSTDQSDVHESEKSVAHQQEQCRALIAAKGWTVAETFTDDGISGAIFGAGRPELARLLVALKDGPRPFDVLVAYDESRLGRDVIETGYLVKQILDHDVRLFFADGSERRLDTATDKLIMSITNFGGEFEREQASKRTKDKMRDKAKDGHATGTVPFGYRSVEVNSHKELKPDPAEAAIVVKIFELSASGLGITKIAHQLNREHPTLRKWSGPTVRNMLISPIYAGQIVYGKTSLVVKKQKKVRVARPKKDWITVERPELRIVPAALWAQVQERKRTVFDRYIRGPKGRLTGRPEAAVSQHLLSGFVECGTCGGRMVIWSKSTDRARYRYLVCWRHRSGGDAACSNHYSVPVDRLTQAVVGHFTKNVLTPARVAQVRRDLAADAEASPEKIAERRAQLVAELGKVGNRIAKLTDAIAEGDGGAVKALVDAVKTAEGHQRAIQARLEQLDATQAAVAEWTEAGQKDRVEALLADWQSALLGAPVVGRQILRKLLVGPIRVLSYLDDTGTVAHSYRAHGSYGAVISGALGTGWNAVVRKEAGAADQADLREELVALAKDHVPTSDDRGGPTS
jgi:site-specific DNA recombinase